MTTIIKLVDDTAVTGLLKNSDETAYRQEVRNVVQWSATNNPEPKAFVTPTLHIPDMCQLPTLEEIYNTSCLNRAINIVKDPSHGR